MNSLLGELESSCEQCEDEENALYVVGMAMVSNVTRTQIRFKAIYTINSAEPDEVDVSY